MIDKVDSLLSDQRLVLLRQPSVIVTEPWML